MESAFGMVVNGMAKAAAVEGVTDCLARVGLSAERVHRAAASVFESGRMSPREVCALSYVHGLTGANTARLAYGDGKGLARFVPEPGRMERLREGQPASWWAEPTSRFSDLGEGTTRRLLGLMMGLDLGSMDEADPLDVPADARYAALAKLSLGEHWQILLGIQDEAWVNDLTEGHARSASIYLPMLAPQTERDEELPLRYRRVPIPDIPALDAPVVFGAGVGMVIRTTKRSLLQLHIRNHQNRLVARLSHLDEQWKEAGKGKPLGTMGLCFEVNSLWGIGEELARRFPRAADWKVVSLRLQDQRG